MTPGHRLRNLKLTLAYEGTRFSGWQIQRDRRTVAGALQNALAAVFGRAPAFHAAGRTDAGVHAEGQVVNFRTVDPRPVAVLRAAIAGQLPVDMALIDAAEVPFDFHARHSAVARTYRYQITRRYNPFLRRHAWCVPQPLSFDCLRELAAAVLGEHDFRSFGDGKVRGELPQRGSCCHVLRADWTDVGPLLCFSITADHFLWKMVRRLVGTMVAVATGTLPEVQWRLWLVQSSRESAPYTAPPFGLFLERVDYPAEPVSGHPCRCAPAKCGDAGTRTVV